MIDDAEHVARMRALWPYAQQFNIDSMAMNLNWRFRDAGVPSRAVTNELALIQRTQHAMLVGRCFIYEPACPHLIAEFPGYTWPRDELTSEDVEDRMPKRPGVVDHSIDAMLYAASVCFPARSGSMSFSL